MEEEGEPVVRFEMELSGVGLSWRCKRGAVVDVHS